MLQSDKGLMATAPHSCWLLRTQHSCLWNNQSPVRRQLPQNPVAKIVVGLEPWLGKSRGRRQGLGWGWECWSLGKPALGPWAERRKGWRGAESTWQPLKPMMLLYVLRPTVPAVAERTQNSPNLTPGLSIHLVPSPCSPFTFIPGPGQTAKT